MVNFPQSVQTLGRKIQSLVGAAGPVGKNSVDLNLIASATHYGCMGLPQDLIDSTVEMLRNDFEALKACSLTCKVLFASTRRLIHETLRMTLPNSRSVLTREEMNKIRIDPTHYRDIELRFLSHMDRQGILQYTRRVHIRMYASFTPDVLLPHFRHFQSLDRVHALTIEFYLALRWARRNDYKTYFAHFYPTLTSLTLRNTFHHYRLVLQFVLQFPHLENLSLEWLKNAQQIEPDLIIPPIDQSPPLHGHLRLAGIVTDEFVADFVHKLPNGINFRSAELEDFPGGPIQHILDGCAHTLENITIASHGTGNGALKDLIFADATVLRQLTLCVSFNVPFMLDVDALLRVLSTIASPVFCELVVELSTRLSQFGGASLQDMERWREVDKLLEEQFSSRGDFRLTIRTGELQNEAAFQRHTRKCFPLLSKGGRVHFETGHKLTLSLPGLPCID